MNALVSKYPFSASPGDDELSTWATQIRSFLEQKIDVYVYFNNDTDGHAIWDSRRLSMLLSS